MIKKFKKTVSLEVFIFDGTNSDFIKLKKWCKDKHDHYIFESTIFKINKKKEVTFSNRFYFGAVTIKLPVHFFMEHNIFCALSQKQFLQGWNS